MNEIVKEFTQEYYLTAGECNPQGYMPVTLIASRIIEVATFHANSLDVGYSRLKEHGQAWVLSRLAIEMYRYPTVNDAYSVTTWIEGFNRHFSERNFEIRSASGETLGYVRSIWVAIDIEKREAADIGYLDILPSLVSDRPCPIAKQGRVRPLVGSYRTSPYRFRFTDCDFNRHVNTVRYIERVLNQWTLDFHDTHVIERFEVSFMQETRYGAEVSVNVLDIDQTTSQCEIVEAGSVKCRALLRFKVLN